MNKKYFFLNIKLSILIFIKKLFYTFQSIFYIKKKVFIEEKNFITSNSKFLKNSLIFSPEYIFDNQLNMTLELVKKLHGKTNIFTIDCRNNFPQCMFKINRYFWRSKNSFLKKKSEDIDCEKCLKKSLKLRDTKKVNFININTLDLSKIHYELQKIEGLTEKELIAYEFENINIYNFVLYDYFIVFKKHKKSKIDEDEFRYIKNQILNNVFAIFVVKQIIKEYKIDVLFMIDEYSFQSSIRAWAKSENIKVLFYQHTYSLREELEITNVDSWPLRINDYKNYWPLFKKTPVSERMVKDTYDNLISRLNNKATHMFSKKYDKNLKIEKIKKLKLNDRKVIGLFTSSDDEEKAIDQNLKIFNKREKHKDVFKSQEEWIDETIKFVEFSNKFSLIIVMHPRLFKSLNSPRLSSDFGYFYKKYNSKNFKNVEFIWPEDNISTYNIIELINISTVAWSSIGIEISLLGIPVITPIEKNFPITTNFVGIQKAKNINEYFEFFSINDDFFNNNYMLRVKESIRWFNLLTFGNSFHKDYCINEGEIVKNILIGKNPIENNSNYFLKSEINEKKDKIETDTILDSFVRINKVMNLKNKNTALSQNINNILNSNAK